MGQFTDTLAAITELDHAKSPHHVDATLAPGMYSTEFLKEHYGEDYDKTFGPLETDPTGRSAKDPGAKLDQGKVMGGLLADFSLALTAVAEVGTYGANKYTRCGWESVPNGIQRYGDAKWRHLLKGATAPIDPESGLLHKAHEAWNVLAELELVLRSTPTDGGKAT